MSVHPADPTPSRYDDLGRRVWRVGTLSYTRPQLVGVFFWLLWGDFCLHLMDNGVIPTLVPLQLEAMGASKALIGLIMGTIVNVMYFAIVPVVSTMSDRYRSRIGRRRPFLLFATFPLAVFLVLLGFSQQIARLLQGWLPALLGDVPVLSIALVLAATFFLIVKFFDLFPQSVYYYMWADVVPPEVMGVFGALFRVFYAAGSLVFNYFLIGLAKEHPEEIYLLSAGLYLVAFVLIVVMVREGQYPPPEPVDKSATGEGRLAAFLQLSKLYIRECFSNAFWWKFFLMSAAFQAGYQPFVGNLVFVGKEVFGDTPEGLASYGKILAHRDIIWIFIYLGLTPIMLKLHPLKAAIGGLLLMSASALLAFLFVRGPLSFEICTLATFISVALYLGGTQALNPRMLPREKFGQFASAGAMIFRITVALAAFGAGWMLDHVATNRYVFLWLSGFTALGLAMAVLVYRDWKRLGGEEGYVPPT